MRIASPFLRFLAVVCALLGLFPLANLLDPGAVPWWEHAVREWLLRGTLVIGVCVAAAWALGPRLDTAFDYASAGLHRLPPRTFGILAALAVTLLAAVLSIWCFAGQPFTSDEMAQQWHARILLTGRLFALAEPFPEFFNTAPVFDRDGRWFSQYPIGAPALTAIGLLVSAPWILNPVLLGLATWWLYRFLAAEDDVAAARCTTLLFALSPMVLIMGASQMNHVPALTFTLLALAALARWRSGAGSAHGNAAVVGLAVGLTALIRPLDAMVVAAVLGAYQLHRALQEPRLRASLITQVVVGAIPLTVLLWANEATTGSPLLFGYEALNGSEHALGFHLDPRGEMHTPRRGLTLLSGYLMRLSRYLFEWPLPATVFIVAGLLLTRPTHATLLLAAVTSGFLLAYGAYWFDGFFAGPRFLFTALPAFVYFTAKAPLVLAARLVHPLARRTMFLVVPMCVAAAWLGPLGESSARARLMSYRDQRTKLKTDVDQQIERAGLRNALVFVNEGWRGRLLARLRVHGISQFRAESVLNTTDACALQTELDKAGRPRLSLPANALEIVRRARAFGEAQTQEGLPADRAIALVPGSRPTAICLEEFLRDTLGTMPYPMFLARQSLDADGRVGGDVVFARDLGARNEMLRERFGDRAWYSYRPIQYLGDTQPPFVPYSPLPIRP